MQLSLQQKMMQGQEITEEDNQQAQEVVARIQQDAKITKLMETEQRLNVVIGDVNKIIMKPLEELYSATTSVIVEDAPMGASFCCRKRLIFGIRGTVRFILYIRIIHVR